ncbi:MAG: SDR family NAD(P)-dependent oxidoreductase, partial [Methylophagaceae bacterium]
MTQTALVTGSNRGIGLEFCNQLQQRGFNVIATCRHSSSALDALGVEIIDNIEVSDYQCLTALAEKLSGRRIDWLINNAGIADGISWGDIDERSI